MSCSETERKLEACAGSATLATISPKCCISSWAASRSSRLMRTSVGLGVVVNLGCPALPVHVSLFMLPLMSSRVCRVCCWLFENHQGCFVDTLPRFGCPHDEAMDHSFNFAKELVDHCPVVLDFTRILRSRFPLSMIVVDHAVGRGNPQIGVFPLFSGSSGVNFDRPW